MAFLRATWSILIFIYMDDMLIQARDASTVYLHAQITLLVFMCLGWEINWEKSSLIPTQRITHLGFILDSQSMTVSCPMEKIQRIQEKVRTALGSGHITVHDLERLLGLMESVRPATPLAAMHYRTVQKLLITAKSSGRRPKQLLILTRKVSLELQWWLSPSGFMGSSSSSMRELAPTVEIFTDANLEGGGAHCSRGSYFQRLWSKQELSTVPSINLLEVRAAREGLEQLARPGDLVRLHIDNRTACCYVRRQGGTRSSLLSHRNLLLRRTLEKSIKTGGARFACDSSGFVICLLRRVLWRPVQI